MEMTNGSITIFDIAREAGVSIATVSRALSDQYNPRSSKQRRVVEIARKYNYQPSAAARSLGRGQSKLLCIVLPEITNPYYSELFSHAEAAANREGYALMMQRAHDDAASQRMLIDQVISRRPDGLLLSGGLVEGAITPEKRKILGTLADYMPIVVMGHPIEGIRCVSVYCDLAEGARKSVRHLHALGHRRIAMIGGVPTNHSSNDREQGYYDAMTALGLPATFEYRHKSGYKAEDGAIGVLKLFSSLPRDEWPTALITINDLVALGALRELHRMGLSVPSDVAVVGCDNQFFAPYTCPPLTTIDLCLSEQARIAVHYLINAQPDSALSHLVDSTLIQRESSGTARSG